LLSIFILVVNKIGTIVLLDSPFDAILKRIKEHPNAEKKLKKRPLLSNLEEAKKLYDAIRNTLETIVYKFSKEIQQFQGDLNTLPLKEIQNELQNLISWQCNTKEEPKKGLHPLIYIVPLIIISLISYNYYNLYKSEKFSRFDKNSTLFTTDNAKLFLDNPYSHSLKYLLTLPSIFKIIVSDIKCFSYSTIGEQ
jgi:hypothetical protein